MEPQGTRRWWDPTGGRPKLEKIWQSVKHKGDKGFTQLMKSAVVSWGIPPFLLHFNFTDLTDTVRGRQWVDSDCIILHILQAPPRFNPIKLLSRRCWHSQRCSISSLWSSRFQTASFMRKHVICRCYDSACQFPPFPAHFSHLQYPPLLMQDSIIRSLVSTRVRHAV